LWAFVARRPILYRIATRIAARTIPYLSHMPLTAAPLLAGWLNGRALPRANGHTFHDLWRQRQ
jgi:L-lactate dehydrogenase complex protein LldF